LDLEVFYKLLIRNESATNLIKLTSQTPIILSCLTQEQFTELSRTMKLCYIYWLFPCGTLLEWFSCWRTA